MNLLYLSEYTTTRSISSVVGNLILFQPAMGVIPQFINRMLQHDMGSAACWDLPIKLSFESRSKLLFWQNNLCSIPGKYMGIRKVICSRMYTDASAFAE